MFVSVSPIERLERRQEMLDELEDMEPYPDTLLNVFRLLFGMEPK